MSQNSQETPLPEFLFKVGLSPSKKIILKKRPWHRCFPVNFAKFLRTPFLQNTSGRQELKGPGLKGEELSENEQLPEDIIGRFEESERRTEVEQKKDRLISKTKKRKLKK